MIFYFLIACLLAVTLYACVSDVKGLRIPNACTFVAAGLFVPAFIFFPEKFYGIGAHLAAGGIFFAITYVMFAKGVMGGGDTKFGSALALWVGLKGLMAYVFFMAIAGGVLGLIALWILRKKPFASPAPESWAGVLQSGKNAVPYGIAISVGAWLAFLHTQIFL